MNLERPQMFGSPLHSIIFLYFTVHAHEDRHGNGVIYQMGGAVEKFPKGTIMLACRECNWDACPDCVKSKDKAELVCPGNHKTQKEKTPNDGYYCSVCGGDPSTTIQKHMGDILDKYFPKPPEHVMARVFTESASHWNYTIAAADFGGPDFFSVNGDCATTVADFVKWDNEILTNIFKTFVRTAEEDKVMVAGELSLLNNLAELWNIDNPENLYSDDIEYRDPPPKPKIEFDDDGDPLCLECGANTYQPIGAVSASMTFGPGGVTYGNPNDNDNHWICEDCGYSFDVD